jgi:DNA-binding MurR/RpiR family transcriptional regulator
MQSTAYIEQVGRRYLYSFGGSGYICYSLAMAAMLLHKRMKFVKREHGILSA